MNYGLWKKDLCLLLLHYATNPEPVIQSYVSWTHCKLMEMKISMVKVWFYSYVTSRPSNKNLIFRGFYPSYICLVVLHYWLFQYPPWIMKGNPTQAKIDEKSDKICDKHYLHFLFPVSHWGDESGNVKCMQDLSQDMVAQLVIRDIQWPPNIPPQLSNVQYPSMTLTYLEWICQLMSKL